MIEWAHAHSEYVTLASFDDKNNINDGPNPTIDRRTNYGHSYHLDHDESRHVPDHDIRVCENHNPK